MLHEADGLFPPTRLALTVRIESMKLMHRTYRNIIYGTLWYVTLGIVFT